MVDPVSRGERSSFALKLKLVLIGIVAASGGLMAVQGGAAPHVVLLAVAGAAVVGAALIWFVFPGSGETVSERDSGRGRR